MKSKRLELIITIAILSITFWIMIFGISKAVGLEMLLAQKQKINISNTTNNTRLLGVNDGNTTPYGEAFYHAEVNGPSVTGNFVVPEGVTKLWVAVVGGGASEQVSHDENNPDRNGEDSYFGGYVKATGGKASYSMSESVPGQPNGTIAIEWEDDSMPSNGYIKAYTEDYANIHSIRVHGYEHYGSAFNNEGWAVGTGGYASAQIDVNPGDTIPWQAGRGAKDGAGGPGYVYIIWGRDQETPYQEEFYTVNIDGGGTQTTNSGDFIVPEGITKMLVAVVGGGAKIDSGEQGEESYFGNHVKATGGGRGIQGQPNGVWTQVIPYDARPFKGYAKAFITDYSQLDEIRSGAYGASKNWRGGNLGTGGYECKLIDVTPGEVIHWQAGKRST